ncbi:MAG: DNA repair exonuclease [Acidithiobacillus ferrooxidans]|nr:DNA repair exonuclease [Acidithiobacillus ferrooxidans]MDD5002724.1 DNA repair exonuclease [Acidithiobacillus sp.]MDD5379007.1 DNA repair exonuclease [Acidithiobacillus sp.]MDD5575748.1 DNA repair exonuclease [Acidithiobacillus sp.]
MTRFLHTADWQIGRQYGSMTAEDAAALAEARFQTVARIAQLASCESVDAVLVAGDVFDAQTVADRSIRRLFNALEAFPGPWIMIPGNHDAALSESVWSRAERLQAIPRNVHCILKPGIVDFSPLGFMLLAAPLTQRHTYSDLTEWFDSAETPDQILRIGIAHGGVQGILADEVEATNPIAPLRASSAHLDYLALGDWHGTKQIDARTWYAGTPEPDRFRNNDAGNILLVEISQPSAEVQVLRRSVGTFNWRKETLHLRVSSDLDYLTEILQSCGNQDVLQLDLSGEVDLAGEQLLHLALGAAEGRLRSLIVDRTELRLLPTEEDIAALHADGYLGEVIAELRNRQQGESDVVAREAMAILATLLTERSTSGTAACN